MLRWQNAGASKRKLPRGGWRMKIYITSLAWLAGTFILAVFTGPPLYPSDVPVLVLLGCGAVSLARQLRGQTGGAKAKTSWWSSRPVRVGIAVLAMAAGIAVVYFCSPIFW